MGTRFESRPAAPVGAPPQRGRLMATLFAAQVCGSTSSRLAGCAAADVSPGARRGRAISLIIWGATAGSMLGPNLLGPAADLGGRVGLPAVASTLLISLGGFGLAALLIETLLRPD